MYDVFMPTLWALRCQNRSVGPNVRSPQVFRQGPRSNIAPCPESA
ncbi:hypothetical protein PoMZ_05367 [Pyricularia oryzae]|uniref:Uncharacterized protein n=1 Tax=Pyricularia oryzae TaxID=318829 RepID=A0A4P7NN41_PYROR|nr:hypothetical protein PoMZ_05367 [Pyricularia oryzae]